MANDRLSESHGQKQTVRSAMHRGGLLDWFKRHLHVTHNKLVVAQSLLPRIGRETRIFIFQLTTGSERTRLKENVSALTAGNPENSLTLRHDHNCRFRSTAAANAVRGSDNTVFPESDEELNFLRRLKIGDW
jgi:hypothetical protein